MKIVIIGGTGLIGSQLVSQLQQTDHEIIAASPSSGVNTLTGEGVKAVLADADVVVDVSNSPSFEATAVMNFFKTSNENLLAAAKQAGVKHHIALSVVGTSQLQASGYFRAKQVQEDMIKASGIPYTIVHATQFFEFAAGIVQMSTVDGKVSVPDAHIQPIASKDVVSFLAKTALSQPANSILEIGGPEKFDMREWIIQYAKATGKNLQVVSDVQALYSGAPLEKDTLTPQSSVYSGPSHYAEWIADPANQR